MGTFLVRRLLWGAFNVWVISVLVFAIYFVFPTGDIAKQIAGKNPTEQQIAQIRKTWHFDDSLFAQYKFLMTQVVTGELPSYQSPGLKVVEEALKALPATFSLAMFAAIIWVGVGVTVGNKGARNPGTRMDRVTMIVALVGISLPIAWLSLYTLYIGSDLIPVFPAGGYMSVKEGGIFQWAYHLLLPAMTLAMLFSGVYARLTRTSVRQALMDEHVKTAIAKGIPQKQVFHRHVLRIGLIPILVIFGLDFGALLGGAIFTESIFGLPGIGSFLLRGISTQDVPILIVGTLIAAVFVMVANIVVDIIQAAVDPRIRLA